jgi:hypothetical protein
MPSLAPVIFVKSGDFATLGLTVESARSYPRLYKAEGRNLGAREIRGRDIVKSVSNRKETRQEDATARSKRLWGSLQTWG